MRFHGRRARVVAALIASVAAAGCDNDGPVVFQAPPAADPGALVTVSLDGKVGVLLDDFPEAMRDRVAKALLDEPESFWIDRAKGQLKLTVLRLNFRHYYYEPYYYTDEGRKQLPLPPEALWSFTFEGKPVREEIDGHDVLSIQYRFDSTLLTTADSPAQSDPALAEVGGKVEELFAFPVDPTLLLQRTGYACMDENQYPPDSVDAENAPYFFDDTCGVEEPDAPICHYSKPLPTESCVEAIENHVGQVPSTFVFERVAWDQAVADAVRVGAVTNPTGPDMSVRRDALAQNRIEYRYFSPDSCAVQEQCIGAPGWRRILKFNALDHNVGAAPLHIGEVNYLADPNVKPEDVENEYHGVYEFSACHQHYHFMHYGEFSFIGGKVVENDKRGFCLESTDRLSNNETTPIHTPYSDCAFQGIEAGWGDLYQAGLPCQWIDITEIDTSGGALIGTLEFQSNPDQFLCEGTLVTDEEGNQLWEETEFETQLGNPVDRPVCDFFVGAEGNDLGTSTVTVPKSGGMLNTECSGGQLGPLRNCGFDPGTSPLDCTPGQTVTLECSVSPQGAPMVVRACEASAVLGQGTACRYNDSLTTEVVSGTAVEVSFKCPAARDQTEPGGTYALYTAPVFPRDDAQEVTCAPKP